MDDRQRHLSFLLRVWLAWDIGQPQWRASLEDTLTGERQGFACLDDLCRYLKHLTELNIGEKGENREANERGRCA